jgi:hypothetical protein
MIDNVNNFFAKYLLKIFDLEAPDSEKEATEKDWLRSHLSYSPMPEPGKIKFSDD